VAAHPIHPSPSGPVGRTPRAAAGDDLIRNVRVGRQAMYDAERRVVSYELLFRGGEESGEAASGESGGFDDAGGPGVAQVAMSPSQARISHEVATSRVIGSTFGTFGLEAISGGKPVFISLTRAVLTGVLPIPVPPDSVIIEVTDQVLADHELLLGLAELSRAGYRIAVDNYRGDVARSALLEVADFVKIDVDSLPTLVVPGLVQSSRLTGATLIASNVRDAATLQRCVELGFELFQGEHLQRPSMLQRRTLSPSQLVCVRLLNELADPQLPLERIEHLVGTDPGLSLRLLRSTHSAAGTGRAVDSLRQALVLIGPRLLRSWVMLTLLEGTHTPNPSDDLWNVLARAAACQRLSPGHGDLGYTVGLLSGAADLLGTDSAAMAETSGVGPEARAALVDGEGEAGLALQAILAHERDDEAGIDATGLSRFAVSQIHLEALRDALALVQSIVGK
jgi:EAL and modified HD-GYP domain-containing signal transduction protein